MADPTPRDHLRPDLAQLKALAHPVRLEIIGILRADGPATASGLAARLGLNSGATSYHLRQLAETGLIVEDASRGNARDRWWQAAYASTLTEPITVDDPLERAVLGSYHAVVAHRAAREIEQAAAEVAELPREWADIVGASDYPMTLTPQQARRVARAVHEVLAAEVAAARAGEPLPHGDRAEAGDATRDDSGDLATAPVVFQFHVFPRPGSVTRPAVDPQP